MSAPKPLVFFNFITFAPNKSVEHLFLVARPLFLNLRLISIMVYPSASTGLSKETTHSSSSLDNFVSNTVSELYTALKVSCHILFIRKVYLPATSSAYLLYSSIHRLWFESSSWSAACRSVSKCNFSEMVIKQNLQLFFVFFDFYTSLPSFSRIVHFFSLFLPLQHFWILFIPTSQPHH